METPLWIGIVALLALVGIVGLFWFWKRADVDGVRARKLVAEGARLVDVRSPGEFAAGHVEGAINLPVDQIDARSHELGEKLCPVVVYCASGVRSAFAKRALARRGFVAVYNLGPMKAWR